MSEQPITPSGLNLRHIYADDLTKRLLAYTSLTADAIDLINTSFALPHGRTLRLRVGQGITYRSTLETGHGDKIELIVVCRADALVFPLEIAINIGVELHQSEHAEGCRYRFIRWKFGDVDCSCPYQDYDNHVIMVNTEGELSGVIDLVQAARGGHTAGMILPTG